MARISDLTSRAAVQAALDEFDRLGQKAFLQNYQFGKAREFFVRNPISGTLADSKAIAGVALGYEFPNEVPLTANRFSGGEMAVASRLRKLGFEVVGGDWSSQEVDVTVAAYFEMLLLDSLREPYSKVERNATLRRKLITRSKGAVEFKHANISAVMNDLGLPFIPGYKPRRNNQLLLREAVQRYVIEHGVQMRQIVDAMEDVRSVNDRPYRAVIVEPPNIELVDATVTPHLRLPRKMDYPGRDERNRYLGHIGEQWVIGFEQARLKEAGVPELFDRLDWVSDREGDGAGFDILSHEPDSTPRYIEVKTTNGAHATPFMVSRNELSFSRETGNAFFLYRVFAFRSAPALYMLRGALDQHVTLEPTDYRASFRRVVQS